MTVLTPVLAERLRTLRSRQTRVENDIETLRQSERHMTDIRENAKENIFNFRKASRKDNANWRGQISERYDDNRNQIKANAQTFLGQMANEIDLISQRRSHLSTELININTEIKELELLAAASGGV